MAEGVLKRSLVARRRKYCRQFSVKHLTDYLNKPPNFYTEENSVLAIPV
jgi:hypothetical protein